MFILLRRGLQVSTALKKFGLAVGAYFTASGLTRVEFLAIASMHGRKGVGAIVLCPRRGSSRKRNSEAMWGFV